jgi:hypothetical protein
MRGEIVTLIDFDEKKQAVLSRQHHAPFPHLVFILYLQVKLFRALDSIKILYKSNIIIIKTQISHHIMFDLKGH